MKTVIIGKLTISDSITNIGDHALADWGALPKIEITDGVISVGNNIFPNCIDATNVAIAAN